MIRVTLEIVPSGVGDPQHLGTIEISNDIGRSLETSGRRGNYTYRLWKKQRRNPNGWCSGEIEDYPRLAYHSWNLIRQILNQVAEANGGKI